MKKVIKLSEINTEDDFWEFADNWYQRTIRLREACNESHSLVRKVKAFFLWRIMMQRMAHVSQIAYKLKIQHTKPSEFLKGTSWIESEYNQKCETAKATQVGSDDKIIKRYIDEIHKGLLSFLTDNHLKSN